MDNMNIVSKFTTGIVSNIATRAIRKKLGYEVNLQLNEVRATVADGKTHIHLDLDAELSKEELTRLLKSIGV